jgi:alkylation response protein AidB-like acyl-CoA dehydrogenase
VIEPVQFALTEDQRALAVTARRLAGVDLKRAAQAGVPGRVNRTLVGALAETGLLPRLFPYAAGGGRADDSISALELCLLREAIAQESTEAETALAMQGLGGYTILQSGQREVVERWVPAIANGQAVAAFALTEPEHGSDAGAIELKALADPKDRGYWLSGVKFWISNAPDADVYVVFARTTPDAGARGLTACVVPGDSPGLSGEPLELLAAHPIGRLDFDGVFVPEANVLGEVDHGFGVAMRTLDMFRPSVGAFAVGMAQAALDEALPYAADRRAFGKPIREFQAVSHVLAEMATRTEAARLVVYAAAAAYDAELPGVTKTSAMAKLLATETAQWVVDAAIQIKGAWGLLRGTVLEHLYREVRAPRIYEGTSEIQREIIARELYRGPVTDAEPPTRS